MDDGKVEVIIKGTAASPVQQTVAIVVNSALKEAGFTEVSLSHTVDGKVKKIPNEQQDLSSILDMVSGTFPHLFSTPLHVNVEPISHAKIVLDPIEDASDPCFIAQAASFRAAEHLSQQGFSDEYISAQISTSAEEIREQRTLSQEDIVSPYDDLSATINPPHV